MVPVRLCIAGGRSGRNGGAIRCAAASSAACYPAPGRRRHGLMFRKVGSDIKMMRMDADNQSGGMFSPVVACWRDVLLSFAVIVALSVAYLHVAEKQYTVSATLAPSDAELNILTGISTG